MERYRNPAIKILTWALAIALLWFVLGSVDWPAVGDVLENLTALQVVLLLFVNTLIVLLFGTRWWLILRAQGHRIPLMRVAAYRLAGFGVSYFTPGPQFGGEPLQVFLVVRRERVPAQVAGASVLIDKLLELSSNFAFLAFGAAVLAGGGLLNGRSGTLGLGIAIGLLLLPLGYLMLLVGGKKPLSQLVHKLSIRMRRLKPAADWVGAAEAEAEAFVRAFKAPFIFAVLLSGIVWAALVGEFVLMVRFLGLDLGLMQVVSAMTAARLAILLPMPGGLGTLEAGLVLVTQALGEGAATGAGLSLLIRARDILFGLAGLWLGRRLASKLPPGYLEKQ